jgi:hypothetical protein
MLENRENQCQEMRKVKGRKKDAYQCGKLLDFGPVALRELECGKT